jgi:DNA-directed RNA polymerase specialized sigma24 family protein
METMKGDFLKMEARKELLNRLRQLEKRVQEIESFLNPGTTEDVSKRFFDEIYENYYKLITSYCGEMDKKLRVGYMDTDDYVQESLIYLLKWCFPKAQKFSTRDAVWVPYIKRSLHNCYVNLLMKYRSQSRTAEVVALSDHVVENDADLTFDMESEYEFMELSNRVALALQPADRQIFLEVLDPPIELKSFILEHRTTNKRTTARQTLAAYYELPVTSVNSTFARIRKTIKNVVAET